MSDKKRSNAIKKSRKSRKIGIILASIQFIVTLVFLVCLILLNVMPTKYFVVIVIVLLFLAGYSFIFQFTKKYKMLGKVVSVFMTIVLAMGSYYLMQTGSMLSDISGKGTKVDEMAILVLEEDPAETINDTEGYTYGINEGVDREKSDEVIGWINELLDSQLDVETYSNYENLVEGLYTGGVQVIIINEAFRELIQETYEDFNVRTRTLDKYEVETAIPQPEANGVDVTGESFHVFISGIDTAGSISTTSRSDVNIIATINPATNQVLLTTTPRDYYIPFPNTDGVKDKLTHAGIYGVDISVGAMEDLYNIKIDYYVRVNFTTLVNLVDALGGVTAYSEYSFNAGGYSFQQGNNDMDGKKALAFSRERKSFGAGDIQRGRNQMEVIKGIVNKALSPSIIVNYSSVMDSVSGSFETNMSNDTITKLIRGQINDDMPSWDIISNNVVGSSASMPTYSQKRNSSVVIPDEESVREAKQKIYNVMNGVMVTED